MQSIRIPHNLVVLVVSLGIFSAQAKPTPQIFAEGGCGYAAPIAAAIDVQPVCSILLLIL